MSARPTRYVLEHVVGMVDSPLLSRLDFQAVCERWNVRIATTQRLEALTSEQRQRSVILVQDAFTRYFETRVATDWIELIARLGYQVYLAPFAPNGKPLQVQGFLGAFERAARYNAQSLLSLQQYGVPLVGLDPAMTLVYRQEYSKTLTSEETPSVILPQEWLATALPRQAAEPGAEVYQFLPHCTEKTNEPASVGLWQQVFERMGLKLEVLASGCCGMSGTYGHETRNIQTSAVIYGQSWQPLVAKFGVTGRLVADGYSCRSQVKRLDGQVVLHPLQVLLGHMKAMEG